MNENLQHVESLSDFQRDAHVYAEQLKVSQQPLILTVDGQAELVVLTTENYLQILDKIEYTETVRDLKAGINSFERGEGRLARTALAELSEKYGLPS